MRALRISYLIWRAARRTIELEQAEIQEHKEEIRSLREALEKKQEKLEAQRDPHLTGG